MKTARYTSSLYMQTAVVRRHFFFSRTEIQIEIESRFTTFWKIAQKIEISEYRPQIRTIDRCRFLNDVKHRCRFMNRKPKVVCFGCFSTWFIYVCSLYVHTTAVCTCVCTSVSHSHRTIIILIVLNRWVRT